jgi:hypothetical protein
VVLQVGAEPNENMPTVLFPTADPSADATVAAVADPLVQLEYVYLLRVVVNPPDLPIEKIPTFPVPAAVPAVDATLEAAATELVQPENVYLLRVVAQQPSANIANVPKFDQFPAATACICWFSGQTPEYGATAPVLNALRMLPI